MPDAPLILCYDGSEDAKHAIQRGGELLAARRALVLTVWLPTAALGPLLAFTANTVNIAELDRAAAEAGDRIAEEGARIARACGLEGEPVAVKARGPSGTRSSKRLTAVTPQRSSWVRAASPPCGPMLLGSVSGGVVHHADRPTLVIRRPSADDSRAA